jgi:2-amino-4-hydroxy-6-hydroxymethyldihydropteridine diphosphokinase
MTPAYIALGSNLQDPLAQLQLAAAALKALPGTQFKRGSSVYRSSAVGPGTQPDYLNAVALITTTLSPIALLDALQQIEHAQGRVRSEHWGARTLDLDILLYGDQKIDSARLTVPHPAMRQRNFVLYPLAEINDTQLVLPDGTDLDTLVRTCPREDLETTNLQLYKNQGSGSERGAMP